MCTRENIWRDYKREKGDFISSDTYKKVNRKRSVKTLDKIMDICYNKL